MTSIVWFRHDLRLADNRALAAAIQRGGAVLPVYIWAPEEEGRWPMGAASRWWLHQSLKSLDADLRKLGSRLVIRRGPTLRTLQSLIKEAGADRVLWNRRYEPVVGARDKEIEQALPAESFNSALLFEPWEIQTGSGGPYRVFTPFWRTCLAGQDGPCGETIGSRGHSPSKRPAGGVSGLKGERPREPLKIPRDWPESLPLAALALEPKCDWAAGLRQAWRPGEAGAREQLRQFLKEAIGRYATDRDRPDLFGTSRLSPHLHFGEVSPRQIWQAVQKRLARGAVGGAARSASVFLSQLGWREFGHHVLHHAPHTPDQPLRSEFARFPWREDAEALRAWQRGRTGYPVVDAGMRELWATGWMHNRVRMIVASFLTKDLLLPWQEGARWFWDTLVDADLANNTLGWQWTAGCGADAAPYFRVFNPVSQGEKFDPEGSYVRRWVPELARLPNRWILRPWEAPASVLGDAGVTLGESYPRPIVDHARARKRALEAYQRRRRPGLTG